MDKVLLDKRDGYAIVTLNRPDEMNALSRELRTDFVAAFDDCSADEAIRVVILTGNGRAFCAGFDLKELAGSSEQDASQKRTTWLPERWNASRDPSSARLTGTQ